jgi:hypothetical protein
VVQSNENAMAEWLGGHIRVNSPSQKSRVKCNVQIWRHSDFLEQLIMRNLSFQKQHEEFLQLSRSQYVRQKMETKYRIFQ